ncbi:MAG: dihydrodipicolinate synthase family protein, partial [Gammaproteobacteria bacterium]|nr:dihydrodipicolinate synthase family protein [Gammaproteobacteria bacterium]
WLISQGVGLAVFGTNSEANSLSVDEKIDLLDQLVTTGIDPAVLMPGTGSCALTDTVRLTAHAVSLGCGGTLMLPPFYYKGVSDDGLFAFFSEVIERVASSKLQIYLYHIPPISQVPLSLPLIERLATAYPAVIAGIKDSSGDWDNTQAFNALDIDDFRVFCGSESFLLRNMQHGGAGCISATANVNPAAIADLHDNWQAEDTAQRQNRLDEIRAIFQSMPMIPALKAATGMYTGDPAWRRVRPPLVSLSEAHYAILENQLHRAGFKMPDIHAN